MSNQVQGPIFMSFCWTFSAVFATFYSVEQRPIVSSKSNFSHGRFLASKILKICPSLLLFAALKSLPLTISVVNLKKSTMIYRCVHSVSLKELVSHLSQYWSIFFSSVTIRKQESKKGKTLFPRFYGVFSLRLNDSPETW